MKTGSAHGQKGKKNMVLIDKAQTYKTLSEYYRHTGTLQHMALREALDRVPVVDAVPVRRGKFIGTEYDGYADCSPVYYEWKCSECGCIFEDDEPTYKYCPNCGARMVEE